MSTISAARAAHHAGASGKTTQPTVPVGTPVVLRGSGIETEIVAVRRSRKYARRYRVAIARRGGWVRRDQFTVGREPVLEGSR